VRSHANPYTLRAQIEVRNTGAQASNLHNMVIGQGMILVSFGVVLGIGGALWLTRFHQQASIRRLPN
jgi:hypothetical protein